MDGHLPSSLPNAQAPGAPTTAPVTGYLIT
jgi:hypothetical protein